MFARMAAYRRTLAARAATMHARDRKSLDAELGVVRHLKRFPRSSTSGTPFASPTRIDHAGPEKWTPLR